MDTDVLVVGAGPMGLMLACQLARRGAQVQVIDRHAGPGEQTRAIAVQARTLEIHAALGARLRELGVDVQWRTELPALKQRADHVHTTLRRSNFAIDVVSFSGMQPTSTARRLVSVAATGARAGCRADRSVPGAIDFRSIPLRELAIPDRPDHRLAQQRIGVPTGSWLPLRPDLHAARSGDVVDAQALRVYREHQLTPL
jgi:hypothetical protein